MHLVMSTGVTGTVNNVVVGTITWAKGTLRTPRHVVCGPSRCGLDLARVVEALKARSTRPDRQTEPSKPLEVRQSS